MNANAVGMQNVTGSELRAAFGGWIDDDFMVPDSHGHWLASKIPQANLKFRANEGHISLGVTCRLEILNEIRSLLL